MKIRMMSAMDPESIADQQSTVAEFVRKRRKANGLSQQALSELAGVSQPFLSDLERGKPTLRMDAVNRVLAVFGKRLGVVGAPR
jgi:y4mF family transcriptional regulator